MLSLDCPNFYSDIKYGPIEVMERPLYSLAGVSWIQNPEMHSSI